MASPSEGKQANQVYVVITDIRIVNISNKDFKPSKTLTVRVNNTEKPAVWSGKDNGTHLWILNPKVELLQTDTFIIEPRRSRRIHRDDIVDRLEFSLEEIVGILDYSPLDPIVKDCDEFRLEFDATLHLFSFETMACMSQDVFSSSENLLRGVDSLRSVLDSVGTVRGTLRGLLPLVQSLSNIHPIAQAAVMVLSVPYTLLKNEHEYSQGLQDLGREMTSILSLLKDIHDVARVDSLKKSIEDIMKAILEVTRYIGEIMRKSRLQRGISAQFSSATLDAYKSNLANLRSCLNSAMQAQNTRQLDDLQSGKKMSFLRDRLKRVDESLGTGCLFGTRKTIIEKVEQWLIKEDGPNILWILGSPGAGKTAIATTLVGQFSEQICGRFFFKRDVSHLRNPRLVWTTIAYGLAEICEEVKTHIFDVLQQKSPSYLDDVGIKQLFEDIVENPLRDNKEKVPREHPLIVIDALDECDNGDRSQWKSFLSSLEGWADLPRKFKLIITSRDDSDIRDTLADKSKRIHLSTGDDVDVESSLDIKRFFQSRFAEMKGKPSSAWPGPAIFEQLTQYSAGLFIWAETVMNFVEKKHNPVPRLASVLKNLGRREDKIDRLYGQVLYEAFKDLTPDECETYVMILGAIIFAKDPLLKGDLRDLLAMLNGSIDRGLIDSVNEELSCVIPIRGYDQPLRVCHQSFVDLFLDGPERVQAAVKDYAWSINDFTDYSLFFVRAEQAANLATASLRLMNHELKFNIGQIPTSHCFNNDIIGLNTRVKTSVIYSCLYWADHLIDMSNFDCIQDELQLFLHEHFLHWLEVLSIIGVVGTAQVSLLSAANAIETSSSGLAEFAQDASRFVSTFAQPISWSVPQIYLSALPFSPAQSEIFKHFSPRFPNTLSIKGQMSTWPSTLFTLHGHERYVQSVAFSPDGKLVASGSGDCTIRIWDANSGASIMGPLKGHDGPISSVGFSSDGKRIVSGSFDSTIRIWNADTGESAIEPLKGHEGKVLSVAISGDSKRIVSGSEDNTIRIWDVNSGTCVLGPLKGHGDVVTSVSVSPDGTRIASGSFDQTIRIWDAETGVSVLGPLTGHVDYIWSVAFSPDGKRIVSGSNDRTVRMWDAITGTGVLGRLRGHDNAIRCVTFSRDGKRIASCSYDRTIRIWNTDTGVDESGPLRGHDKLVLSIGFSPDGRHIVSGSGDYTVGIWDVGAGTSAKEPIKGQDGYITAVQFFPDGKRLVSGSGDRTVCIWDADTGTKILGPLNGHEDMVTSVAISPDGAYIVSGSRDKTIRIWNADTGTSVLEPLNGHEDTVWSIAFSPDGTRIASGSADKTIHIWDMGTGASVREALKGHYGSVRSVAISGDGKRIVSGSKDHTIRLWDVETGISIMVLECDKSRVLSVAISPDGKRIVSGSTDSAVRVWDAKTGARIMLLDGHNEPVHSVAFSPDGNCVASGSSDHTIRIWDLGAGASMMEPLNGHNGNVFSVTFSPDGKRLASGSRDRAIRIWDLDTEANRGEPRKDLGGCGPARSSPDGERTALGSETPAKTVGEESPSALSRARFVFRDGKGLACIHDRTFMENGWVFSSVGSGEVVPLFWVPLHNRAGLLYPRNSAVIAQVPTQLDLSRFMHGDGWEDCRTEWARIR